jgi:hypothetical protein
VADVLPVRCGEAVEGQENVSVALEALHRIGIFAPIAVTVVNERFRSWLGRLGELIEDVGRLVYPASLHAGGGEYLG